MSGDVVIVQHGEKVRQQGNPGLTALGRKQADAAALLIAASSPRAIFSSPLLRARETAAPLAQATGLPIRIDERLCERMNLEAGESPAAFFADWVRSTQDRRWSAPGSRSSHSTGVDMSAAVSEALIPERVVAVFGHGGATVDLLRTLLSDEEVERRSPGLIDNGMPGGGITRLRRAGSGWLVLAIAETEHLSPSASPAHRPA